MRWYALIVHDNGASATAYHLLTNSDLCRSTALSIEDYPQAYCALKGVMNTFGMSRGFILTIGNCLHANGRRLAAACWVGSSEQLPCCPPPGTHRLHLETQQGCVASKTCLSINVAIATSLLSKKQRASIGI